jgi:hypothetical protein
MSRMSLVLASSLAQLVLKRGKFSLLLLQVLLPGIERGLEIGGGLLAVLRAQDGILHVDNRDLGGNLPLGLCQRGHSQDQCG